MFAVVLLLVTSLLFANGITSGPTNSYISVPGKVLPGPMSPGSFKVARDLTLNQCAAECSLEYHLNKFHCYAFEYASASRMCVLTNVTSLVLHGGYLGLLPNSAMQYFERSKGTYLNLFQPFPNQVLEQQTTYFAVFHNMTLEKCALFCLIESRDTCMSFSYSQKKQVCGLSKVFFAKNNGQKMVSSSYYSHYQYFTTWPCNATIPWNYSPRAIASPYFPYASLKDVRCHLRLEAPAGKQVDLKFSTFFTQKDICKTANDGLSIIDGDSPNDPLLSRLCTSEHFANRRFQSSSGYLYLEFSTESIPIAFKAVYDFITVDPCAQSPCKNNGTCLPHSGQYSCACVAGYTGTQCETEIDECASSPCYLGGRCIDLVNGFKCNCPKLLGGKLCNEFVGLCYLKPCQNGGTCSPRGTDKYICNCPHGFTGENCTKRVINPCDKQPCLNGGKCTSNQSQIVSGTYSCTCVAGFIGSKCQTNINECSSNPCLHSIQCTDLINDYRCECPPFLSGKTCEQFIGICSKKPCVHGECKPTGRDNYTCSCVPGYTGVNCDSSFINFCQPTPCDHGKCTSYLDGPSCDCDLGYEGFFCDKKTDYCEQVVCNYGECVTDDYDFKCNCITGYEGRYCNHTIDHCLAADCNGGYCINTLTSYFCVCKDKTTGPICDNETNNACDDATCKNGTCVENIGRFVCDCELDYTGTMCDTQIDYCITSPCTHGQCANVPGGYQCKCEDNYTGTNCENVIDHCKVNNPCVYGFCDNNQYEFKCVCAVGYHGDLCQYRPDEVAPTTLTTSTTQRPTFTSLMASTTISVPAIQQHFQCSKHTCNHGKCDPDFPNVCNCFLGYSGRWCDTFDGCTKRNLCLNGNCSETGSNGYSCACEQGFSGSNCEVKLSDVGPCSAIPCQNNGVCIASNTSGEGATYRCLCVNDYWGDNCEHINTCNRQTCIRNGTCVPFGNWIRCEMFPLVGSSSVSTSVGLPFWSALATMVPAETQETRERISLENMWNLQSFIAL